MTMLPDPDLTRTSEAMAELDTANRNDPETCRKYMRTGPVEPPALR